MRRVRFIFFFFCFFSSRRRHTRLTVTGVQTCVFRSKSRLAGWPYRRLIGRVPRIAGRRLREVGRASCRGRGEISGGARSFKKKKTKKNTQKKTTIGKTRRVEGASR